MKTLFVEGGAHEGIYRMVDPDACSESELEFRVVSALSRAYPNHVCIVFGGGFRHEGQVLRPDLALIARDFSHWFIIEVELTSHSLEHHVLPQVRAFTFGESQPDCVGSLSKALSINSGQAETLLRYVPRKVAVIANKRDEEWAGALRGLGVQMLSVTSFVSADGSGVVELEGSLEVVAESLGFGIYRATDRSLRFPTEFRLPNGLVQIQDPAGAPSSWLVTHSDSGSWVTKEKGVADFEDGLAIQIVKRVDGMLSFRRP